MSDQRMKRAGCLLAVVLLASLQAQAVMVAPYVLVDNASSVTIDPSNQAGTYQWNVDGVNQLAQQWFWYRVGSTGPESPVNALAAPFVGVSDSNFNGQADTLYAKYVGSQLQVEMTFTLTGDNPGVFRSDLAETIKLKNLTNAPLDLHFFQYCNLDLGGTPLDESVAILGGNTAQQSDVGYYASETVETPLASHRQAGLASSILAMLNDGAVTTLNDNAGPMGPGDLAWAFQWDATLGPVGSGTNTLIISKDKTIVPEPATMCLLAAGGLALLKRKH